MAEYINRTHSNFTSINVMRLNGSTHDDDLHVHVHVGRALCLEYRVSWVRVPPEAARFF